MLKCAWYGWRSVSSSDDGFFRNVTPRSCGPAVTGMRTFRCASTCLDGPLPLRGGGFTVNELHALAVEQHLQLVRLAQALDVLVAVARQPDLDVVLAVLRERVADQRAAARAERQPVDVLLLREVRPDAERVAAGRPARAARPPAG